MDNFYTNLIESTDQDEYLERHINEFNKLSNNEIQALFNDEKIAINIKTMLAERCYNRITTLPYDILTTALFYIEDEKILEEKYQERLNKLSFQELVTLIYDINLDANCLIKIANMDIFNKYLAFEKENHKGTNLQSFSILKDMYLADNTIEELKITGEKIILLLNNSKEYTQDIEILINTYLSEIIEENKNITIDNNINKIGLELIKYCLQNHKLLSDKMIKYYALYRIKDLNLQSYCKNVDISRKENPHSYGDYQMSKGGTLTLYTNYIPSIFYSIFKNQKIKDKDKVRIHDLINIMTLQMLSHELGHIVIDKKITDYLSINAEPTINQLEKNMEMGYWYKNGMLHYYLREEEYHKHHDMFIEEVKADLFAMFDSNKQINNFFKDAFSQELIQNWCADNANKIIFFYTSTTNNTKNFNDETQVSTPIEKFNNLCDLYLPPKENINVADNPSTNIMERLLLGDKIPRYVLEGISKIATKEIVTSNLYKEIITIIEKQPENQHHRK